MDIGCKSELAPDEGSRATIAALLVQSPALRCVSPETAMPQSGRSPRAATGRELSLATWTTSRRTGATGKRVGSKHEAGPQHRNDRYGRISAGCSNYRFCRCHAGHAGDSRSRRLSLLQGGSRRPGATTRSGRRRTDVDSSRGAHEDRRSWLQCFLVSAQFS